LRIKAFIEIWKSMIEMGLNEIRLGAELVRDALNPKRNV